MSRLLNETDDDLQLPQRGAGRRTMDAGAMHHDDMRGTESDREFTLSTGTVLGLFFALALVCAIFFGFGYTMGRKSVQSAADSASAAASTSDAAPVESSVSSKPAAGSPAIQAIPGYMSQGEADSANRNATAQGLRASAAASAAGTTVTIPVGGTKQAAASSRTAASSAATSADARVVGDPVPVAKPAPVIRTAPAPAERAAVPIVIQPSTTMPAAGAGGAASTSYVQIAAVSHKEDADVLLSALKRRGYSVFTRSGDGDKLIHVQVGPFASKKDAEAMRQKLLGDGYNAILK